MARPQPEGGRCPPLPRLIPPTNAGRHLACGSLRGGNLPGITVLEPGSFRFSSAASARTTDSGSRSMTVSSTRAARSGTRRPCSHSCTARTSRPKRSANFCRLSFNRLRRAATRPAAGSAGQRRPRHAHGRRPLPTPSRYPVRFRCVPSSFPLPLPFDFRHQPRQRLPPRPEPAQRNWSSQCGTDYASVSLAMLATGSSSAKSSRSTRPRPSGGRSTKYSVTRARRRCSRWPRRAGFSTRSTSRRWRAGATERSMLLYSFARPAATRSGRRGHGVSVARGDARGEPRRRRRPWRGRRGWSRSDPATGRAARVR